MPARQQSSSPTRKRQLVIDGGSLRLADAAAVLAGDHGATAFPPAARKRVAAARAMVKTHLASGEALYGINTGFGKLSRVRIADADLATLQQNLLLSHAAGVGEPLPPSIARLALLLRANALAGGRSGVRIELVERLLAIFDSGAAPCLPSQGSVGASGDLAPLAHMALLLIGRGEAWLAGKRVSGKRLLALLDLEPLALEPKEGLALINGTQVSTALAVAGVLAAQRLAKVADVATALSLEALRGTIKAFDARIHAVRPHPGQRDVARNVRALLAGSEVLPSHAGCDKVQDPYSLRCAPQVHGASRDAFAFAAATLEREMNSVTDNPLLFAEDGVVLNGGNFHAEPVAMAADFTAIAAAELANVSERRIENMVNPDLSGLPAFLAGDPGLDSGFMIAQVTAAALVSENKTLAHPASVDSIPTSAGKEDHVSMATWAGRKLLAVTANVERVLAIELLAAAQALDLQGKPWLEPGRGAAAAYRAIRRVVPAMKRDREMAPDIEKVRSRIADGSLLAAVESAAGELA
jgi:histidine ammonia-lyase